MNRANELYFHDRHDVHKAEHGMNGYPCKPPVMYPLKYHVTDLIPDHNPILIPLLVSVCL